MKLLLPSGLRKTPPFAVIGYLGGEFGVSLCLEESAYAYPEAVRMYLPGLESFWHRHAPGLQDKPSIVSLRRLRIEEERIILKCQPATYFQFLFTNMSLGTMPVLDLLWQVGALGKLQISKNEIQLPQLCNSVGITVVVLTADERVILTRRSHSSRLGGDYGAWQCAVGTQIKRHEPRFLEGGVPSAEISARQGCLDELGEELYASLNSLRCIGAVWRIDRAYVELVYMAKSSLNFEAARSSFTNAADAYEFDEVRGVEIHPPGKLLQMLEEEKFSPQHAAAALMVCARYHPDIVSFESFEF